MISRRQVLGLAAVPFAAALVACQGNDPRLGLLRADSMASWKPPNLVDEVVREQRPDPTVEAGNSALLMRELTFGSTSDASQGLKAILTEAESTGWVRARLLGESSRAKALASGVSGSLSASTGNSPFVVILTLQAN